MALLRPCGNFIGAISKLPKSCQLEYLQGIVNKYRFEGYVTDAPKPSYSKYVEKFEPTINYLNINEIFKIPRLKPHLQRQLLTLCKSAKNKKIHNEDLLELFKSSITGNCTYDNSIALAVLQNCGKSLTSINIEDRRNFVDYVWEVIKENTTLSLTHYNTLLRVHIENDQIVDPKKFLSDMTVNPNNETYRLLLKSSAKLGKVDWVFYLVSIIKEIDDLNEDVYNYLIEVYIVNKDLKLALNTLETTKASNIEPSLEAYSKIACGYISIGDIENTMNILKEYSLSFENILEIVQHASKAGYGKYISQLLKYLPSFICEYDPIIIETIKAMIHSGNPEDTYETIKNLIDIIPIHNSNRLYESFLKNLIYAKFPSDIIIGYANRVSNEMNYSLAIIDICEAALQTENRELALAIFEVMQEKNIDVRPHYYWPILLQSSKLSGEADVLRTLKHMLCLNVPVDHTTLLKNVFPVISTDDPLLTLRKLNDIGLETSKLFTPLICYLLYRGRIKDAHTLCHKIRAPIDFSKVIQPLAATYKSNRNVSDCAKIFKFARPNENYPDEFLLSIFGENLNSKELLALDNFHRAFKKLQIPLKSFNKEKKDSMEKGDLQIEDRNAMDRYSKMNLEELECHLVELRSKGINDRGVLRTLLQLNCRMNKPERVEQIRNEFEANEYPWTPGMYSSLLQFYSKNDNPEEALRLYRHLKKNFNGFKINNFRIIHLATSLINKNYINEAIELLETNRSDSGHRTSGACWRLLDSVARGPNSELTESILDILVNAGFCDRTNVTLGPLVREHLLKNDVAAAVDTFRKCAKIYKHTPLRQELINVLVTEIKVDKSKKEEYTKYLNTVQKSSINIYGNISVNMDLLTAFARNEMIDELKAVLAKHRITDKQLIDSLDPIPNGTKIKILMTILDNTMEAQSGLDRVVLYENILYLCNQSKDCERAIKVWKKMSADNLAPSQKCRKQFVSLLKHHKVPVPDVFDGNEV